MSRALNDLAPIFRPLVVEFLAQLVEANIPVIIVETFRTQAKHEADLASGHSWVKHSKHQDGLAIDICPYEEYELNGIDKLQWDPTNPIWQNLGVIGKKIGMGWGGDWTRKDMGHFEYIGK